LCDVVRVAVKDCFKLLSFFTFIMCKILPGNSHVTKIASLQNSRWLCWQHLPLNSTVTVIMVDLTTASFRCACVWRYNRLLKGAWNFHAH